MFSAHCQCHDALLLELNPGFPPIWAAMSPGATKPLKGLFTIWFVACSESFSLSFPFVCSSGPSLVPGPFECCLVSFSIFCFLRSPGTILFGPSVDVWTSDPASVSSTCNLACVSSAWKSARVSSTCYLNSPDHESTICLASVCYIGTCCTPATSSQLWQSVLLVLNQWLTSLPLKKVPAVHYLFARTDLDPWQSIACLEELRLFFRQKRGPLPLHRST